MLTEVCLVNHATVISDVELQPIVRALRTQLTMHFSKAWGLNAILTHLYPPLKIPSTSWVMGVFDTADVADALGYHDVTPTGLPLGKVFAKTTMESGATVSVVLSHELLEMLADAWINVLVQDERDDEKFWIREVCDAVEADDDGYDINGVRVSNFCTPAYYEPMVNLPGPFDWRGLLPGPIPAVRRGGYLSYLKGGSWNQIFGRDHAPTPGRAGGSGRIMRRMRGTATWERSTFQTMDTPSQTISPTQTA